MNPNALERKARGWKSVAQWLFASFYIHAHSQKSNYAFAISPVRALFGDKVSSLLLVTLAGKPGCKNFTKWVEFAQSRSPCVESAELRAASSPNLGQLTAEAPNRPFGSAFGTRVDRLGTPSPLFTLATADLRGRRPHPSSRECAW
ncbi:Hypothetical predicted protein [Cloeon dipterum]|uniref:Uncharacterized protein n=1 Tax=Cloeon dipterum TaxID=197152 RepID=A0A8S1CRF6_9INSE|nr:Hypothetical predicted protein [Cloeon dipterum]